MRPPRPVEVESKPNPRREQQSEARSNPRHGIDWERLPPVLFVLKWIAQAPPGQFSSSDQMVAVVIADMMGPEVEENPFRERKVDVCFALLETIAERAKVSVGTVKRCLANLCDGEFPLFIRTTGGVTRGHRHKCNRYELVRDPAALAENRRRGRTEPDNPRG